MCYLFLIGQFTILPRQVLYLDTLVIYMSYPYLDVLSTLRTVLFNRPRRYLFFIMNSIQLYKDCYSSIGILYTYDREHIHLCVDTLFKL
nr:MAG TPA: hypothetical protein [Caudoviricetes sp.]